MSKKVEHQGEIEITITIDPKKYLFESENPHEKPLRDFDYLAKSIVSQTEEQLKKTLDMSDWEINRLGIYIINNLESRYKALVKA